MPEPKYNPSKLLCEIQMSIRETCLQVEPPTLNEKDIMQITDLLIPLIGNAPMSASRFIQITNDVVRRSNSAQIRMSEDAFYYPIMLNAMQQVSEKLDNGQVAASIVKPISLEAGVFVPGSGRPETAIQQATRRPLVESFSAGRPSP